MHNYSFEKLEVWQESRTLVKLIYDITYNYLPKDERFSLSDQMKRAVISVSSNIAEGTSRFSAKEKIRFIEMSFGSLMELYSQLLLCVDLNYFDENELCRIKPIVFKISNLLNSLKAAYSKQLNS